MHACVELKKGRSQSALFLSLVVKKEGMDGSIRFRVERERERERERVE